MESTMDFLEFKLYVYTPEKTDNDLDGPRSTWTVSSMGRGAKQPPGDPAHRRSRATTLAFYPYVRPYYGIFTASPHPPPKARP